MTSVYAYLYGVPSTSMYMSANCQDTHLPYFYTHSSAEINKYSYTIQALALTSHRARAIQISHRSHTSTITERSAASAAWHHGVPTPSYSTASVASTPSSTPRSATTPRNLADSTATCDQRDSKESPKVSPNRSSTAGGHIQAHSVTDNVQAAEPAPAEPWPAGLDPLGMLQSETERLAAADAGDEAEEGAELWPAGRDVMDMVSSAEAEAQTAAPAAAVVDQAEEPAGIWPVGLDPMAMLGTAEVEAVAEEAGAADGGQAMAEDAADSVGEDRPTDGNTEDGPTDGHMEDGPTGGGKLDRLDVPSHTPMFSWLRNLFGRHRPTAAPTTDGPAVVPPESSVQIAPTDEEADLPSGEGDVGLPPTPVATSMLDEMQLTPPEVALPPELGDAVGDSEQVPRTDTPPWGPAGLTAANDGRNSRMLLMSQLLETEQQLERNEAERQRLLLLLEQQGLHNLDATVAEEDAAGIGEQLPPMLTREVPEREMPWSVTLSSMRSPPTETQASPYNSDLGEFGQEFGGHNLLFAGLGAAHSPVPTLNQSTAAALASFVSAGSVESNGPTTDDESVDDEALLLPD